MPHLEVRIWIKLADGEPIEGHAEPGWYMGVKHFDGELEVLSIDKLTTADVRRFGEAVRMNGKRQSDLMPWIERMNRECLDSINRASQAHDEAARKNLTAIVDLAKIQEKV